MLKRRRSENFDGRVRGFAAELATLEFLNAEETAVAPRLIGASADLLLMEDLGPGSSLAHALLARDPDRAEADLAAYARALATVHAWSMGRAASFSSVRARRAPSVPAGPEWPDRVAEGKEPLLEVAARLGLPVEGAAAEIDSLNGLMHGSGYTGLVHGDPCPDNTHIVGGRCRIFDFETAARVDELPRLHSLASALRTVLHERWPSAVAPSYPALARPGEPLARVPREWPSSD
jgi:hypothetical protein